MEDNQWIRICNKGLERKYKCNITSWIYCAFKGVKNEMG